MSIREITTKKGQKMAFVRIEDMTGDIEAVVFPGVYDSTKEVWQKDNLIISKGKVTSKDKGGVNGETKIMIDDAKLISEDRDLKTRERRNNGFAAKAPVPQVPPSQPVIKEKRVYVRIPSSDDEQSLKILKTIMDSQPGTASVVLVVGENKSKQAIRLPARIEPSDEAITKLEELFGKESIKFQ
jgi:DNA polymerase-3 subunit alpha